MKYKLIVSDLDGTLLDSKRNVSIRTVNLIQEFISKGGVFTFATGRMESSIEKYVDSVKVSMPAIIYNGSKIADIKTGKTIYEETLDYNLAKTALKVSREYDWDVLLYLDKKIYVNKITNVIEEYMFKDGVQCEGVEELHDFLKLPPTKILIIGDPCNFIVYVDRLSKEISCPLNYVISEYNYLEILPDKVSKGNALRKLAEKLEIPMEQVIAIGDNLNDISMIKTAGLGIAVENAHDDVKKAADFITRSNDEEGVAEVLFRVVNELEFK